MKRFVFCLFSLFLVSCGSMQSILHNVDERDANLIIVLLESKGIKAVKVAGTQSGVGAESGPPTYDIAVDEAQAIFAMSFLNKQGLPRRQGQNLLDIFQKSGLMSSDKEETIRYQSGLAQQIANMVQMIDGVIDAVVQLSFPNQEATPGSEQPVMKTTAAVFIKHQGTLDDPNLQIESKVKRLVASSVPGLDIGDVTVISDRARLSDVTPEAFGNMNNFAPQDFVKIWSVVMTRESALAFRALFFTLLSFVLLLGAASGWFFWKLYPIIRSRGFKSIFSPEPLFDHQQAPLESME